METALLHIGLTDSLHFLFRAGDRAVEAQVSAEKGYRLSSRLLSDPELSVEARRRIIQRSSIVPSPIVSKAKKWLARQSDGGVIAVLADGELSCMPWEAILAAQGLVAPECLVVHALDHAGFPPLIAPRSLAVGWPRFGAFEDPVVERELDELARRFSAGSFEVRTLPDPSPHELLEAIAIDGPGIVHLSTALRQDAGGPKLPAMGEGGEIAWIPLDVVESVMGPTVTSPGVKIVILNGSRTGYPAAERLCRNLNAVVVGWDDLVDGTVGSDFALFLFQRLSEGHTLADAVHAFARSLLATRNTSSLWRDCLPVIYYPNPDWVDWRPIPPQPESTSAPTQSPALEALVTRSFTPETTRAEPVKPVPTTPPPEGPWIRVDFTPLQAINPALLVNGIPPIESISLDSPRRQTVRLRIDCDTGAAVSTYRQTLDLEVGMHPSSMANDVFFPVLHELVERKTRRRRIVMTLTVESLDGTQRVEITKSVLWMGADEWIDRRETWQYVPAFVDPFDPVIAEIIRSAVPVLRTIGDPTDDFSGYQRNFGDHTSRQMQAIFQALRDDARGIRYATPAGGAIPDPGRARNLGQFVRRHREVLERRLGTCHDLALLLAACAEHISIHPLVVLVPGHTFFGFWRTHQAHRDFWTGLRSPTGVPTWTIDDAPKLKALVDKGDVVLVEATDICRASSYVSACDAGKQRLEDAVAHELVGFDVAIDVRRARDGGVQPV